MSTGCHPSSIPQNPRDHLTPRGMIQGAVTWQVEEPVDMEKICFLPEGEVIETSEGTALIIKGNKAWYKVQFLEDGTFSGPLVYAKSDSLPPKKLAQISSDLSGAFYCSFLSFAMLLSIGIGLIQISSPSDLCIGILGLAAVFLSALTAIFSRHIWSAQFLADKHALQYAKSKLAKDPVLVSLPASARHLVF